MLVVERNTVEESGDMTIPSDEEKNARAIEKLRSWEEISKSTAESSEPTPEDYATELKLFEQGEVDEAVWAKHLVKLKGNEEQAKWAYLEDRAATACFRREEVKRTEREVQQKAAEEARSKRAQLDRVRRKKVERADLELKNKQSTHVPEPRSASEKKKHSTRLPEPWSARKKRKDVGREDTENHAITFLMVSVLVIFASLAIAGSYA